MLINNNLSSPNISPRLMPIEYIIIHYTEMEFEEALNKLTDKNAAVSAHYLIKDNGEIFQLVRDDKVAWHAGESSWKGQEKLNRNSIGIEIDNLGNTEFSSAQIKACLVLTKHLINRYNINPLNFIGHSDVAPSRKLDPGIFFDWRFFAENGIGIWHDCPLINSSAVLIRFNDRGSEVAILQTKLRQLGYSLAVSGCFDMETNYVVRAFQAKFCPDIIKTKGLEFYRNLNSLYEWDLYSNQILDRLGSFRPYNSN